MCVWFGLYVQFSKQKCLYGSLAEKRQLRITILKCTWMYSCCMYSKIDEKKNQIKCTKIGKDMFIACIFHLSILCAAVFFSSFLY